MKIFFFFFFASDEKNVLPFNTLKYKGEYLTEMWTQVTVLTTCSLT